MTSSSHFYYLVKVVFLSHFNYEKSLVKHIYVFTMIAFTSNTFYVCMHFWISQMFMLSCSDIQYICIHSLVPAYFRNKL